MDDAAMLHSMRDDDRTVVIDLIDHPVVSASRRVEPGQLANQGLVNPAWVLGDGPEDRLDRRVADLAGKLVEVA
jgi:hypothetical protein